MDAIEFLASRYLEMLDQGASSIISALDTIADADCLPLVFHCSAGKDRTGVLAAVLLSVLGVSDDDIAADYALSRGAMRELADWVRTERPESYETMAAQPPAWLDAPPVAMRRFLAKARTTYGSLTEYVIASGFGADGVAALQTTLLS
jgi:protein tyrosine/serine phosphatase